MVSENGRRRLPVRYETVELDGAWEGWDFEARTSIPMQRYGDLMDLLSVLTNIDVTELHKASASLRDMMAFLRESVRSWNFVDVEGEALPVEPQESWAVLPFDLVRSMFVALISRISEAPLPVGVASQPTSSEVPMAPSPTNS